MLQDMHFQSNFEVIIIIPGQNFIKIAIHGDDVR